MDDEELVKVRRESLTRMTEAAKRVGWALDGENNAVIMGGLLMYIAAVLDAIDSPMMKEQFLKCVSLAQEGSDPREYVKRFILAAASAY
jgi:hypothetical protein